ncbi:MAG: acylating sulfoacetaldehyde dehydrogenase [Usitatibacter sp.]
MEDTVATVRELLARARAAQSAVDGYDQARTDELALAAAWAIMEPGRNRELAELAVRDTGLGDVEDKVAKNYRKTLGLLRDLRGARTAGVIDDDPRTGITRIARPVGVVAAVTPSTNPAATPANNIVNALKGRNAIVIAPSPKGWTTGERLVRFVRAELERVGAPPDLVQILPSPITRELTAELMRRADLVVATGSQANIRAAYSSGTPALGVGQGNVAVIVDAGVDLDAAAGHIARSKTFDNATSCSSENSVVLLDAVYDAGLPALERAGGVLLDERGKKALEAALWTDGKLSPAASAQSAARVAHLAGLGGERFERAGFLMVLESGTGPQAPFSGEKLSPVLAVYRARDFDHAIGIVRDIYAYQGAGHSVGIHTREDARALRLGQELPVSRVIVNQSHCFATGGSFDNGLPFSLSMGCGTWGRNSFSDNLNYTHFINITRVVRVIPPRQPSEEELLGEYFAAHGR